VDGAAWNTPNEAVPGQAANAEGSTVEKRTSYRENSHERQKYDATVNRLNSKGCTTGAAQGTCWLSPSDGAVKSYNTPLQPYFLWKDRGEVS